MYKLINLLKKITTILYSYFISRQFNKCGKKFRLHFPSIILNPQRISIGDNVGIGSNAYLNCGPDNNNKEISLKIGSGTSIGRSVHINAYFNVTLEEDVLVAERVHISDVSHIYSDDKIPIIYQGCEFKGKVLIKKGAWIGSGAVILPGVTIGENAVIGANAVVTRDVPPNHVARGVPARVFPKKS